MSILPRPPLLSWTRSWRGSRRAFGLKLPRRAGPDDTVPLEARRDLRGLDCFFAWLNPTDAQGGNPPNAVVEEDGIRFVRHYLIDFGAILGSDSDRAKDARFGHEFILPEPA